MNNELIEYIKRRLSECGFWMYTTCNCGGVFTEKFKNSGFWKVNLCPRKGTFFVIKAGVVLKGKKIEQFDEVFNQYLIEIQEA